MCCFVLTVFYSFHELEQTSNSVSYLFEDNFYLRVKSFKILNDKATNPMVAIQSIKRTQVSLLKVLDLTNTNKITKLH